MGLFGPRKIRCPAGKWTKIISNFGSGYPRDFHVTFTTDDGGPVAGRFIEKRCFWIFPQSPAEGPLTSPAVFHRNWINAIYSVSVRPRTDCWASVQ